MAGRIYLEHGELRDVYAQLRGAPLRVQINSTKALARAAEEVKDEMAQDARGHRHLPRLGRGVVAEMLSWDEAQIGIRPRNRKQGSLAHIIAYGSVNNAPVYDHTAGPRRAIPKIERIVAEVAETSLFGRSK